jgi:hypothetical protein
MTSNQSRLKYVTGPVSYTNFEFNVRNFKKTIHLFGDIHFSKANNCQQLKNITCSNVRNIVDSECEGIELLFLNIMDYAQKNNMIAEFYFEVAIDLTDRIRVKRPDDDYLSDIEQEFNSFMLRTKNYTPNIKFHYVDSRKTSEYDSDIFFQLYWLMKNVSNPNLITYSRFWKFILSKIILPYLPNLYFSDDFQQKISDITNLIQQEVTEYKNGMRNLYGNVPSDPLYDYLENNSRVFLRSILKQRGGRYISIIKAELDKLGKIQPNIAEEIKDFIRNKVNTILSKFSPNQINIILLMEIAALYMDAYFLARMIYAIYSTNNEQIMVVYAGDNHIQNYLEYFTQISKLTPILNIPISYDQNGKPIRCLENNAFRTIFHYANPVMNRDPLVAYKNIYLNSIQRNDINLINQFISSKECFNIQADITNVTGDVNLNRSFIVLLFRNQTIVGTSSVYFYNKLNQYVIFSVCINSDYRRKGYVESMFNYIRQTMNNQSVQFRSDPYSSQLFIDPYSPDSKNAAKSYIKLGYKNPKIQIVFPTYSNIKDRSVVSIYPNLIIGFNYVPIDIVDDTNKENTMKKVSSLIDEMKTPTPINDSLFSQLVNLELQPMKSFEVLSDMERSRKKKKENISLQKQQKESFIYQKRGITILNEKEKRDIFKSLLTFDLLSSPFYSLKFISETFKNRKDVHFFVNWKDLDYSELSQVIIKDETVYNSKYGQDNKEYIKKIKEQKFNIMSSNTFSSNEFYNLLLGISSDFVVFNACITDKNGIFHNDFMIIYQNYFPKKWVHLMTKYPGGEDYFDEISNKIDSSQFEYRPIHIYLSYNLKNISKSFYSDYLNLCNRFLLQYFSLNPKPIYPIIWNFLNEIEKNKNLNKTEMDKYVSNIITMSLG